MLSTTAEYALRIMISLTEWGDGPMTSERIAGVTQVPPDYAVKVLQMLGRAKLVWAQRGRGGGFQLACDPSETSLLDVVNAIDPLKRIEKCPLGRESHEGTLCPLHRRIDEVTAQLQDSFAQMSLRNVVEESPGSPLCGRDEQAEAMTAQGKSPARATNGSGKPADAGRTKRKSH